MKYEEQNKKDVLSGYNVKLFDLQYHNMVRPFYWKSNKNRFQSTASDEINPQSNRDLVSFLFI